MAKLQAYNAQPEIKERKRQYQQRPDVKERQRAYAKAYNQIPANKERQRANAKRWYHKKKNRILLEKQIDIAKQELELKIRIRYEAGMLANKAVNQALMNVVRMRDRCRLLSIV